MLLSLALSLFVMSVWALSCLSAFSQKVEMPETLYESVVEADERVVLCQETCQLNLEGPVVTGTTGEKVCVYSTADDEE